MRAPATALGRPIHPILIARLERGLDERLGVGVETGARLDAAHSQS